METKSINSGSVTDASTRGEKKQSHTLNGEMVFATAPNAIPYLLEGFTWNCTPKEERRESSWSDRVETRGSKRLLPEEQSAFAARNIQRSQKNSVSAINFCTRGVCDGFARVENCRHRTSR